MMSDTTRTFPHNTDGLARVQIYSVTVVEGPDTGKSFDTGADRCSIGTHASNNLQLNDPTVSRFHCELRVESGLAKILDLESKNGTSLDGVRVCDAYLRHGSLITLGQSVLRFQFGTTIHNIQLSSNNEFGALVGQSIAMRALFDVLERAAPSNATILLEGETGTGKGITAESIHDHGSRQDKPFTVVDCAAIPANLLESELFGHERGAFSGAVARRVGAFESANGGTIFLDEIGELPIELQPKLLRVLEERQIRRVGSNSVQNVDVRVIAATNRDLRKEVNEGRFRSDLYYRLAMIRIRVPALREHPEDIPLLVDRFLKNSLHASEQTVAMIRSPEFVASLRRSTWPGNVRELRNHLERCLVLRQTEPFSGHEDKPHSSAPPSSSPDIDPRETYHRARLKSQMHWEAEYLRALVNHHEGKIDQAARAAGISRAYIYRLLSRHGIQRGL